MVAKKWQVHLQGGPPTSYKYCYNSTYRGYNHSYPFTMAIQLGYNSIYS